MKQMGQSGVGRGAGTVGGWQIEGPESGEVENEVLVCLERLEITHLISRGRERDRGRGRGGTGNWVVVVRDIEGARVLAVAGAASR